MASPAGPADPTMQLLINIDVPDLAAARAVYCQAFGLRPARRLGPGALELLGAQAPIYLLEQAAGSAGAPGQPRRFDRHWTPLHLDVVVDDLDRALARALAAGMHQQADVAQAAWGRSVVLSDPFGHGWCLLQFLGEGYDAIATA